MHALVKTEWISEDRLRPYMKMTWNCRDLACEIYVLDRRLSAYLFQDISYLEVALRNSISH